MSDMTDTLTNLVQQKMGLEQAVMARDALIVRLLIKFNHREPFRVSKADAEKAAKYAVDITPQKTGLKVALRKLEDTPTE